MLSLVDLRSQVSAFAWFFGGTSRALCEYDDEASVVEEDEKIRACLSVLRDFEKSVLQSKNVALATKSVPATGRES
jgi:hypothetical protein